MKTKDTLHPYTHTGWYRCDDCSHRQFVTKREFWRAFRCRCCRCGSTWLRPTVDLRTAMVTPN